MKKLLSFPTWAFALLVVVMIIFLLIAVFWEQPQVRFYLQPHQDVNVTVNGLDEELTLLNADKTLGYMALGTERIEQDSITIRLEKEGFVPLQLNIALEEHLGRYQGENRAPLWQFHKAESSFELVNYWASGHKPKSVTFIDDVHVSVPLMEGGGTDIINIRSGEIESIQPPREYARHEGFVESLVLKKKKELWITQMSRSAIHIFDLRSLDYRSTISLDGEWPKVLLYDPFRNRVYCSNWASKDISVIDVQTRKELDRIKVQAVPRGMVLSGNGRYLYATQFTIAGQSDCKGRVVKIDLNTNEIVKKMGGEGAKRHAVKDSQDRLFVSDMCQSQIEVYDLKTDHQLKIIEVHSKPNTIKLSPDEQYLYVSCRGPNNPEGYKNPGLEMGRVYVIDTNTFEVIEFWEGGNQPTGLDISPDGRYLVSSDFLDDRIRVHRLR